MLEILTAIAIASGGSLVNFLATKTYNFFTGESKTFLWKNKYKGLNSFKISLDFDELKKRIHIIVIDDEDSFPVSLFRSEGYNIEKWDKVTDYGKLESGFFDIIVLDIKGVAQELSSEDGLGILESLKQSNSAQIIIAYSQHSFDLSKARFWQLADEKIAKPSDFLKIKNIIDNLINTKFTPQRYVDSLHSILEKNNFSEKEIGKVDRDLAKSIVSKTKPNWNALLGPTPNKVELVKQLNSITNTLFKFF